MLENAYQWIITNPISAALLGWGLFVIFGAIWRKCVRFVENQTEETSTSTKRNGLPVIRVKRYQCNVCDKLHQTRKEADDCCPTLAGIIEYTCAGCGTSHKTEVDAKQCCPNKETTVIEVEAWKCSKCKTAYEDKTDAQECCN